jgi:hypothetical protein
MNYNYLPYQKIGNFMQTAYNKAAGQNMMVKPEYV